MEKIKALADHYKMDAGDLKNKFLSDKLIDLKLDGTGNKETLSGRLFDALKLKVIDVPVEKPVKVAPVEGMKKTAGYYAIWKAERTNVPNAEAPVFNWKAMTYIRTLSLPHSQAKILQSQSETSGMKYKIVKSKSDR